MSRLHLLSWSLLGILGCGGDRVLTTAAEVMSDVQVAAFDQLTPSTRFDGQGGSLMPGTGWEPNEPYGNGFASWVAGTEAEVRFLRPLEDELDLFAFVRPLSVPDKGEQRMRVVLNGQEVEERVLVPPLAMLWIPLPAAALVPGINELSLRFSFAVTASDLPGATGEDRRKLAAAFLQLAVLPRRYRGYVESRAFLNQAGTDPGDGSLILPLGGTWTLPLPAASEVGIELAEVTEHCPGCPLEVGLLRHDAAATGEASPWKLEPLWQGEAKAAAGLRLGFTTPDAGHTLLAVRIPLPAGGQWSPESWVRLRFAAPPTISRPRSLPRADRRPDVFIYLIDTLRADALEPYGSARATSPRITELTRDAVTYTDALSPSGWTLPAVVSVLTGTYPFQHGIMDGSRRFAGQTPSLQRLLAAAGYETVGISQSFIASHKFGVDSDFDSFFLANQLNGKTLRSQDVRRTFLQWLLVRRSPEKPLFCFVHTVDPHAPYTPAGTYRRFADMALGGTLPPETYSPAAFVREGWGKDPYEVQHLRALYDGEVLHADEQLGRFLAMLRHLGLYENSLVVLLSDHGEEFADHGSFDHGRTLYQEQLRVPLIVKYPRSQWAGSVVTERVSTLDLAPTIAELVGSDWSALSLAGESLLPSTLAAPKGRMRPVFAELSVVASDIFAPVDYSALALGDVKCIENALEKDRFGRPQSRWQTFDLAADPGESVPLAAADPQSGRCRKTLETWLQVRSEVARLHRDVQPTSDDAREVLRALGYIR